MIPDSDFGRTFLRLNHLVGVFDNWLFQEGMRFGETTAWWKQAPRRTPHEGLDLLFFADRQGRQRPLPDKALTPAAWQGMVVAECKDFLGSTVVLGHDIVDAQAWRLHSLYGHTRPLAGIGERVTAGQPVARLAATGPVHSNGPPSHLHLSLAWFHPELTPTSLDWPTITNSPMVRLVDPVCLLGGAA